VKYYFIYPDTPWEYHGIMEICGYLSGLKISEFFGWTFLWLLWASMGQQMFSLASGSPIFNQLIFFLAQKSAEFGHDNVAAIA